MLNKLKIKDFALIEDMDLSLEEGMTALTGETGSGKSLVLDALASILGAKCNTMNIRSGARKYQIEVQFDIKNNEVDDFNKLVENIKIKQKKKNTDKYNNNYHIH